MGQRGFTLALGVGTRAIHTEQKLSCTGYKALSFLFRFSPCFFPSVDKPPPGSTEYSSSTMCVYGIRSTDYSRVQLIIQELFIRCI